MDHTSCISVCARQNVIHPFSTFRSVLCTPFAISEFKKFIEFSDTSMFMRNYDITVEDRVNIISNEIEFLKLCYILKDKLPTINELLPDADISTIPLNFLTELAKLSSICADRKKLLLDKSIVLAFVSSCAEFLEKCINCVEPHFNSLFDNFKQTNWMKYKCFAMDGNDNVN